MLKKLIKNSKYENVMLSPFKWSILGMLVICYFLLNNNRSYEKTKEFNRIELIILNVIYIKSTWIYIENLILNKIRMLLIKKPKLITYIGITIGIFLRSISIAFAEDINVESDENAKEEEKSEILGILCIFMFTLFIFVVMNKEVPSVETIETTTKAVVDVIVRNPQVLEEVFHKVENTIPEIIVPESTISVVQSPIVEDTLEVNPDDNPYGFTMDMFLRQAKRTRSQN